MAASAGAIAARRKWKAEFAGGNVNTATATLEAILVANGFPTTRYVTLEVPEGTTLYSGSQNTVLAAGDLSAYAKVKLSVRGNVHANGGGAGSVGGLALNANNQPNYTIELRPTGEIRGGGGGGGKGGKGGSGGAGGYGEEVTGTWTAYTYSETTYRWVNAASPTWYHFWAGGNVTAAGGGSTLAKQSGYLYQRGANIFSAFYQIRRNTYLSANGGAGGAGGAGGNGGVGQGYAQAQGGGSGGSIGVGGSTANYRAGTGGRGGTGATGGTGGSWASVGATGNSRTAYRGNTGATGYSYYNFGDLATTGQAGAYGLGGVGGGAAGAAIINTTGVTFNNLGGIVSGAT